MTDTHEVHLRVQPASNVRTDTVAAGHLPLRLQIVWMWRTDGVNTAKGQTKIAEVTETGDVDISGSWAVPSVTNPTNAGLHQLSLALFAYPAEAASGTNVGMGTVSLGDVTVNPSFEFELLTKGVINQNVRLSFSVAFGSQQEEKKGETPATAAAEPQAAAPAPQEAREPALAAPAPAQPEAAEAPSAPAGAGQQEAPAGDDEPNTPPAYDDGVADSRVSTSELRVWIADVVSEIREGLTEPYNRSNKFASEGAASLPPQQEAFAVRAGPVPWGESVMCVLDDPILRRGHAATRKTMPTVVVEELLLSSVLEVYLNATQWGPEVALAIRQETGQKILSLLHLPETTSHRVHTDNGMATSAAMQQVQRFGLLKANNADAIEDIETMKARQLVVYIGDETYAEWVTCEIIAQLRFDVPMLTLRRVKLAEEGSIDLAMLEGAIREDEARGSVPVAVVGRMGNLGKAGMDDLAALGGICTQHHMWLHVEGPGVFCLHSSGSTNVNAAAGALRQSVGSGRLNVSVTLCLHEVPGFRNLQGFWVFSSGPHGAIVPPQERSPESDIASLRYCLPAYMRLRTVGLQQAFDTLSQRIGDAERLLEGIGQLNELDAHGKSPAVVVKLHTHASNPWMVLFTFLPFDHPLVLHDAHGMPASPLALICPHTTPSHSGGDGGGQVFAQHCQDQRHQQVRPRHPRRRRLRPCPRPGRGLVRRRPRAVAGLLPQHRRAGAARRACGGAAGCHADGPSLQGVRSGMQSGVRAMHTHTPSRTDGGAHREDRGAQPAGDRRRGTPGHGPLRLQRVARPAWRTRPRRPRRGGAGAGAGEDAVRRRFQPAAAAGRRCPVQLCRARCCSPRCRRVGRRGSRNRAPPR